MNVPHPAEPDDGPDRRNSWFEIFGPHDPIEGRRFNAGDRVWTVVAITPDYLQSLGLRADTLLPGLAEGWLSFECRNERRRIAPIPADWETMTADELSRLCSRATPARSPHHP